MTNTPEMPGGGSSKPDVPVDELVDFYNERATELEGAQLQLRAEIAIGLGDDLTIPEKIAQANLLGRLDEVRALRAYLRTRGITVPDTPEGAV